jgi:hypothetical protein
MDFFAITCAAPSILQGVFRSPNGRVLICQVEAVADEKTASIYGSEMEVLKL